MQKLIICLCFLIATIVPALADEVSSPYETLARELLSKQDWQNRLKAAVGLRVPRLAVRPFDPARLPIPEAEGEIHTGAMTDALVKVSAGRFGVVDRQNMKTLIREIHENGTFDDQVNPIDAFMDNASIDYLVIGEVRLEGRESVLTFKMVELETGRIFSSATARFARTGVLSAEEGAALTLDGAFQAAAGFYAPRMDRLERLMVQGMRYQDSGVQSVFGRYVSESFVDALRDRMARGPRSINDLDVAPFQVDDSQMRGLKVTTKKIEDVGLGNRPGQYLLSGNYWLLGDVVEIRLSIADASGNATTWRGKVRKSAIPENLGLVPPIIVEAAGRDDNLGPISLYLSTNKGRNPVYGIGQTMVLAVQTDQEAHLYCFYAQADRAILKIFPNRFVENARLPAGVLRKIPSVGMPFEFEMAPPAGVEAIKCFALDQDVDSRLPSDFRGGDFGTLSVRSIPELTSVFRRLEGVKMSEATLVVTVEP